MEPVTVIVDNEFITLRYLPEKKIIYHTVHQPISYPIFKDALDAGAEALKKYGACKWLSDDRLNGPLEPEMQAGPKVWGADLVAAGWKYWAIVIPEDIAAAGTLKPVVDTLFEIGLHMMVFTSVEVALRWLDGFLDEPTS